MSEKDYNPNQKENKAMAKQIKSQKAEKSLIQAPVKKEVPENKEEVKSEDKTKVPEEKVSETKPEEKTKKAPVKVEKVKKDLAVVNAQSVPVSTKYAIAICRFIKNKRIGDAIRELEEVTKKRKSVPMKGEYAHRKGPGKIASGAGKYPVRASKEFIVLLKSLAGNSNVADIDEPIIAEAIANNASSPMGRFGRWERKRSHIKLVAKEMKIKVKEKKKQNKTGSKK